MSRARCNQCHTWCATFADRRISRAIGAFDYRLAWALSRSENTEELICDRCLPFLVNEATRPTNDTAA